MIRMDKVQITAFRYLGASGSCFTAFQAVIWLSLYLGGAVCKYAACGSSGSKQTFKYCFYLMYYYEPQNTTANFTRLNFINPTSFHIIMWLNVAMCISNLVLSIFTAIAFFQWKDPKKIRLMACLWTRCMLFFSVWELMMFIVFACDVASIQKKDDIQCFLKQELTVRLYSNERTPAPYLLQLKSNLLTIKKKIKKYKKNLILLDAVFDENSPDHVENPFISKNDVNNYVEDIWKSMFNNSIREKVRRKSDALPFDDVLRNFIINQHLDLDDVDHDLLRNFDELTNDIWMKPVKSSNVVFGRQLNFNSSMTKNETAELDKIKNRLTEYLENTEMPTTNDPQFDQNFDDFFKKILDEIEEQETQFAQDKDDISDKDQTDTLTASNDDEDILFNLRRIFDSVVSQEENEDTLDNQTMQTVINKMKEYLEESKDINFTDDRIFNNITEFLQYEFEINNSSFRRAKTTLEETGEGSGNFLQNFMFRREDDGEDWPDPTPEPTPESSTTTTKPPFSNNLVKELCENCAYFVLGPSIVCMVLAIKTGLVWFLNIVTAILVMYYGSKIELKIKYKCFRPKSKKK